MSKIYRYADIAPFVPLAASGRQSYTYRIPRREQQTLQLYECVQIPFGSRKITGIVVKQHNQPSSYPLKEITKRYHSTLTEQQITFANWIVSVTGGSLGFTLRLFQPASLTPRKPDPKPRLAPVKNVKTSRVVQQLMAASPQRALVAFIEKEYQKRRTLIDALAKATLAANRQALIVVPEQWMTAHYKHAIPYHSGLKTSEKKEIWHYIKSGAPGVIIGTQKALFLPYQQLHCVCIEEEYLATHKMWDQYPRLHNNDAVKQLTRIHRCALLYSSSRTSSLIEYLRQNQGLVLLQDNQLVARANVMTYAFEDKLRHYKVPNKLIRSLNRWIASNEKILLFYNRRDASELEKITSRTVPKATQKKLIISTSRIFAQDPEAVFDHIIWLFPERDLFYPDYRSRERGLITLHRLQQRLTLSRRNVIIVSRYPDQIQRELLSPPQQIYQQILKERQGLQYPPYTDLVLLTVTASKEKLAVKQAQKLRQALDQKKTDLALSPTTALQIWGPFKDFKPSSSRKYERHLVITGPLEQLVQLHSNTVAHRIELNPERIL